MVTFNILMEVYIGLVHRMEVSIDEGCNLEKKNIGTLEIQDRRIGSIQSRADRFY